MAVGVQVPVPLPQVVRSDTGCCALRRGQNNVDDDTSCDRLALGEAAGGVPGATVYQATCFQVVQGSVDGGSAQIEEEGVSSSATIK